MPNTGGKFALFKKHPLLSLIPFATATEGVKFLTPFPRSRRKLDSVPEVTMSASDCPQIAILTEGFTFAYLKEAFVATLFYLFQQREEALAKGQAQASTNSNSSAAPSVFLAAFENQVTMLKEQMGDEKTYSDDNKKTEKKEGDDDEQGTKKSCAC